MDEFGLEPDDPFEDAFESLDEPKRPPPSFHELDKLQYHIDLQDVGERLQNAANAAFPNDKRMRYSTVYVLMLCWEDEDPKLPVSIEVDELCEVFHNVYRFIVDMWKIPSEGSHKKLNQKVLDFVELGGDSKDDLKIVYYGGHGMLAHNRHSCWASRPNPKDPSYRMVKWSGIQHALEEAESDILLLFDCCASGTANTDVGYGVTELIAACGFNGSANPVGPDSFTKTLITELRLLSGLPSFTIGVLYNKILCRVQSKMPEGREMQKSPLHVVLSQNRRLPNGIQLSPQREVRNRTANDVPLDPSGNSDLSESNLPVAPSGLISPPNSSAPSRLSSSSPSGGRDSLDHHTSSSSISSLFSDMEQYPRIAFTVRRKESLSASEVSVDLLADWLRMMPVLAENIKVEAGFASLSTLLIISVPVAIWCYLTEHPAVSVIGLIKSMNFITRPPVSSAQASSTSEKSLAAMDPSKGNMKRPDVVPQALSNIKKPEQVGDGLHLLPTLASIPFLSSKSPATAPELDTHPHIGPHELSHRFLTSSVPTTNDNPSAKSRLEVPSVSVPANRVSRTFASPMPPSHKAVKSGSKKKVQVHYSSSSRESRKQKSSGDSGYDGSRHSSPVRMSDLLENEHEDERYSLGAVHEALDAANGRIKQLETSIANLSNSLAESNKENRRLKRENHDISIQMSNLMDDLDNEKRLTGILQRGSTAGPFVSRTAPRTSAYGTSTDRTSTVPRREANPRPEAPPSAPSPPPTQNPFTPYPFISPRPPAAYYAPTTISYAPATASYATAASYGTAVSYAAAPTFTVANRPRTTADDPSPGGGNPSNDGKSPNDGKYPNDGRYHMTPI